MPLIRHQFRLHQQDTDVKLAGRSYSLKKQPYEIFSFVKLLLDFNGKLDKTYNDLQ